MAFRTAVDDSRSAKIVEWANASLSDRTALIKRLQKQVVWPIGEPEEAISFHKNVLGDRADYKRNEEYLADKDGQAMSAINDAVQDDSLMPQLRFLTGVPSETIPAMVYVDGGFDSLIGALDQDSAPPALSDAEVRSALETYPFDLPAAESTNFGILQKPQPTPPEDASTRLHLARTLLRQNQGKAAYQFAYKFTREQADMKQYPEALWYAGLGFFELSRMDFRDARAQEATRAGSGQQLYKQSKDRLGLALAYIKLAAQFAPKPRQPLCDTDAAGGSCRLR